MFAEPLRLQELWKDQEEKEKKEKKSDLGCIFQQKGGSVVKAVIMGKEQDLLVAVKSGDLLLAHKLLSKVKCNKTSECEANS